MIRLTKFLLAGGLLFVTLGPASAGPQKGKGGGKGGGHGGIPPGHVKHVAPPGQVRNAALGSAYRAGYPGGYYPSPYYPNYYGNNYYRPYYSNSGFWPGFGVGLALGSLSNLPYRSFGGYSPYYYPAGSVLPPGYVGTYSAPATAAVLGVPAVLDPTSVAEPTPVPAPMPVPNGATPVYMTVRVPDGAQVWVADVPSNQTGPTQSFVSPADRAGDGLQLRRPGDVDARTASR